MSQLDTHAISLGIHHIDRPINKSQANFSHEHLAKEMRITFDIDELANFFSGFTKTNIDTLFTIAGC